MKFIVFYIFLLLFVYDVISTPVNEYRNALNCLHKNGYISENDKVELIKYDSDIGVKNKQFKRALEEFQNHGQIPVTGMIDKHTIDLMTELRCSITDNRKAQKRRKKWDKGNLSWSFNDTSQKYDAETVKKIRNVIKVALDIWQEHGVLRFTEIYPYDSNADFRLFFVNPDQSEIDIHVLSPNTLGHAFQPGNGLGGDGHFRNDINWDFDALYKEEAAPGKTGFYAVVLHELGHAMGLAHSTITDTTMDEFHLSNTSTLHFDVIRRPRYVDGIPRGRKYKKTTKKLESESRNNLRNIRLIRSPYELSKRGTKSDETVVCIYQSGLIRTFHSFTWNIAPCLTYILKGPVEAHIFYRTSPNSIHEACVKVRTPSMNSVQICQFGEIRHNNYIFPQIIEKNYTVKDNGKEVIYDSPIATIILDRDGTTETFIPERILPKFDGACTLKSLLPDDTRKFISNCIIKNCSDSSQAKQSINEIVYEMIELCIEKDKFQNFAKEYSCSVFGEKDVSTTVCEIVGQILQECPRDVIDEHREKFELIYAKHFKCAENIEFSTIPPANQATKMAMIHYGICLLSLLMTLLLF